MPPASMKWSPSSATKRCSTAPCAAPPTKARASQPCFPSRAGAIGPGQMTLKEMARPMAAQPVVDDSLTIPVRDALVSNALPGELDGFSVAERDEAAAFVVEVGLKRKPGELALRMKSIGGEAGKR